MMNNDTVARIVDLMFQELEMNEEVAAIRDEIMDNCQERYNDMVASGLSEDDAIGAVVESLKGMEDVLAQYKRRSHQNDMPETEAEGEQNLSFAAHTIHRIDLTLIDEDVSLEESDDDEYHVIWDADDSPLMKVTEDHGVLRIERGVGEAKILMKDHVQVQYNDGKTNYTSTENYHDADLAGIFDGAMKTLDGTMRSLGQSLKSMFAKGNMHIHFGFGNGGVTIQIPENAIPHVKLLTTSGDIDVQEVAMTDLNVTTTSGDITIELNEEQHLHHMEVRTTSGDINVTAYADSAAIASTSGDVEVEGRLDSLNVSTISGDIDVQADAVNVAFKAISGDVELEFDSDELRVVHGSTISGDIDIDLPRGIGFMSINTHTRSGDVTTRCHTNGVGPTVTGSVTSMSGDITIN